MHAIIINENTLEEIPEEVLYLIDTQLSAQEAATIEDEYNAAEQLLLEQWAAILEMEAETE